MRLDHAERLGRRIAIHLMRNEFAVCHNIIDHCTDSHPEANTVRELTGIAEVLDPRETNTMEKLGYVYLEDLEGIDWNRLHQEIVLLHYVGQKTANEITDKLKQYFQNLAASASD